MASGTADQYLTVDNFQCFQPFFFHDVVLGDPSVVSSGRREKEVHVCTSVTLNQFIDDGGIEVCL